MAVSSTTSPPLLRTANAAMAALFLFSAGVQYNDPDAAVWIAVYMVAALGCVLRLAGRLPRWYPLLLGLVALAWAATLALGVFHHGSVSEAFGSWKMKSSSGEELREMLGLLIVAAWMAVLAFVARRGRSTSR